MSTGLYVLFRLHAGHSLEGWCGVRVSIFEVSFAHLKPVRRRPQRFSLHRMDKENKNHVQDFQDDS